MWTAAAPRVEVGVSARFVVLQAAFIAACAGALYLAVSAAAGPLAGLAAACVGAVGLTFGAWRQALGGPRCFWLAADGSIRWIDRRGRQGRGWVTAAVRAGGRWVSLSVQAGVAAPSGPLPGRAARRRAVSRRCAWLLSVDALASGRFRALAARVPRVTGRQP
jgi:hypothetical protein